VQNFEIEMRSSVVGRERKVRAVSVPAMRRPRELGERETTPLKGSKQRLYQWDIPDSTPVYRRNVFFARPAYRLPPIRLAAQVVTLRTPYPP